MRILPSLQVLLFYVFIALTNADECSVRYRRSWYSLTQQEQLLYITGFQQLRKNGALEMITASYSKLIPHTMDTSLFFFIHEHLVYEAENAIRALGGSYSCFSMPYWDFSMESSIEHDPFIFTTGLGGDGDIDNDHCIRSPSSNWIDYKINCLSTEIDTDSMCCLKRSLSSTRTLASSIEIAFVIQSNPDFESFTAAIKRFTDYVHVFICTEEQCPISSVMASEDPIFFLLSSFLGYIRSLWTDCNDYDLYQTPNMFAIDSILNDLFYDFNGVESVRSLYDISLLDIRYDLGSFWTLSKLDTWCNAHINNAWFVSHDMIAMDADISSANPVNAFVDKTWSALDDDGLSIDDKFKATAALTCDFVRRTSLNSCFNEDIMHNNVEGVCDDMSSDELDALTLNDLHDYVSDEDNGCLAKIRSESWAYSKNNIGLKQALCNGEFDYKCSVRGGDGYDGLDDISGILSDESSETQYINPARGRDFLAFDTSLWSVLAWCCMFIFIFMMCCYVFTVKKNFETEIKYKKHRKTAHIAIYGAVAQV